MLDSVFIFLYPLMSSLSISNISYDPPKDVLKDNSLDSNTIPQKRVVEDLSTNYWYHIRVGMRLISNPIQFFLAIILLCVPLVYLLSPLPLLTSPLLQVIVTLTLLPQLASNFMPEKFGPVFTVALLAFCCSAPSPPTLPTLSTASQTSILFTVVTLLRVAWFIYPTFLPILFYRCELPDGYGGKGSPLSRQYSRESGKEILGFLKFSLIDNLPLWFFQKTTPQPLRKNPTNDSFESIQQNKNKSILL